MPPLFFSNHSLTISLSSEVGSGMESDDSPIISILRFLALVDSGPSHCLLTPNTLRITTFLPNLSLLFNFGSLTAPQDLTFLNPLPFQSVSIRPELLSRTNTGCLAFGQSPMDSVGIGAPTQLLVLSEGIKR